MLNYSVYKLLHLIGIFSLFLAVGSVLGRNLDVDSNKSSSGHLKVQKSKWSAPLHGVGLLLIIVSGFGMAAKLGIMRTLPTWMTGKLLIWVILGSSLTLAKRKLIPAPILALILIALGGLAAYLGLWKPIA